MRLPTQPMPEGYELEAYTYYHEPRTPGTELGPIDEFRGFVVWVTPPEPHRLSYPLTTNGKVRVYPTYSTARHAAWNHWYEKKREWLQKQAERLVSRGASRDDIDDARLDYEEFMVDPFGLLPPA